jgi:hypothetical protein
LKHCDHYAKSATACCAQTAEACALTACTLHNVPLYIIVPGRTIEHRDRRRRFPKLELEDREPMERRTRDLDTLAREQLPNLRQAQTVPEPPLDGGAMVSAQPIRRRVDDHRRDGARAGPVAPPHR